MEIISSRQESGGDVVRAGTMFRDGTGVYDSLVSVSRPHSHVYSNEPRVQYAVTSPLPPALSQLTPTAPIAPTAKPPTLEPPLILRDDQHFPSLLGARRRWYGIGKPSCLAATLGFTNSIEGGE